MRVDALSACWDVAAPAASVVGLMKFEPQRTQRTRKELSMMSRTDERPQICRTQIRAAQIGAAKIKTEAGANSRLRFRATAACLLLGFAFSCWTQTCWAQNGDAASDAKAGPAKSAEAAPVPSGHQPSDGTYIIGPDDLLAINVWKEPEISRSVPVRSDGHISLPLVGEVQAAGQTPRQLQEAISKKLQSYISEPDVAVMVQEVRSHRFNVLGQVNHPGEFLLANTTTVLDAIAVAGGFKDFAKQKSIYVLRQNPDGTQSRLPFNYRDVVKGKNIQQNIKLQPRDTVIVP